MRWPRYGISVSGIPEGTDGMEVYKCGRTSCTTKGRICGTINMVVFRRTPFYYMMKIEGVGQPFSCDGDSGSSVFVKLDDSIKHIGVLVGGMQGMWSLATNIAEIMAKLRERQLELQEFQA